MIKRKLKPCKTCFKDSYIFSHGNCKTCAGKKKSTPTGELELFVSIWSEREHFSELTNKPLLPLHHPKWHWQFLHVLNKLRFPSLRLEKRNIMLALPEEHERQDSFLAFEKRKEELLNEFYTKKK
jgi:hypothetical protein